MLDVIALLLVMGASAGFILCDQLLTLKYKIPREDGQRLYLRSVTYGVPCLLAAILLKVLLFAIPSMIGIEPLIIVAPDLVPVYTALSAPVLAYLFALAFNYVLSEEKRIDIFRQAMLKDDFDAVLWKSMDTYHPILISLENRKVYVGLVADGLEPGSQGNSYLTILPLLSGYRTTEKMNIEISAVYNPVIDLLAEADNNSDSLARAESLAAYYMAFPRSKIISLHLFNDHLYADVTKQNEPTVKRAKNYKKPA